MSESPLWRRSWQAILAHALFRLESAITIGVAIIAIGLFPQPFPFWRWWYWLPLFLVAEALIVWTSVTDQRTAEQVVQESLRQRFDPRRLRVPHLQAEVERALQYRQAIESRIANRRSGVLRDRLEDIAARVDQWLVQICGLAERLDRLGNDILIDKDSKGAPEDIRRYRARIERTTDLALRRQLESTLAGKETQLANLQELARTMERGHLQLENTINDLGTIYSQVLLLEARDVDSGRMQRLTQDIDEQVAALSDVVTALDELYKKSAEA